MVQLADGTKVATYEYGPFGEAVGVSGAKAREFSFRFSSKFTDDETSLVYYGYRYLNSSTGRWLSRDFLGESGGLNLHQSVQNDPLNRIDALGLEPLGTLAELFPDEAAKLNKVKTGSTIPTLEVLPKLFPKDAAKVEKVMQGLSSPKGSIARKEAGLLLKKALTDAPKQLREMAIKDVLSLVLTTPRDKPSDYIPGLAGAVLFVKCVSLQADCYSCLSKDPCDPKCEKICNAAKKCFEIAGQAADALNN